VTIYKLITEHTIEEHVLAASMKKAELNDAVLGEGQFADDENGETTHSIISSALAGVFFPQ